MLTRNLCSVLILYPSNFIYKYYEKQYYYLDFGNSVKSLSDWMLRRELSGLAFNASIFCTVSILNIICVGVLNFFIELSCFCTISGTKYPYNFKLKVALTDLSPFCSTFTGVAKLSILALNWYLSGLPQYESEA